MTTHRPTITASRTKSSTSSSLRWPILTATQSGASAQKSPKMPKNSHDVPNVLGNSFGEVVKRLFHSITLRQTSLSAPNVTTSGCVRFHISQKGMLSLLKSRNTLCMPNGVTTPASTNAPSAAAR